MQRSRAGACWHDERLLGIGGRKPKWLGLDGKEGLQPSQNLRILLKPGGSGDKTLPGQNIEVSVDTEGRMFKAGADFANG